MVSDEVVTTKNKAKLTTTTWKLKAIEVHGSMYDYSKVTYTNTTSKVVIVCKGHGEFPQNARNHLRGQGCPTCGRKKTTEKTLTAESEILARIYRVHGDTYDYTEFEYKGHSKKSTIICKEHGKFEQDVHSHLKGSGCPQCFKEKLANLNRESPTGWSYSDWEKAGNNSSNFQGFSLYVIKCTTKDEEFIKIGKTFTGVYNRFKSVSAMPYKYRVLTQVFHNAYAISKLEEKIKATHKEHKYIPTRDFSGTHECLSCEIEDNVLEMANK